jgi:glutathione synthase/RimK-type ligase-like ATP-grasp enzyme
MNTNLKILARACQQAQLPYRSLHPSGNLLEVTIGNRPRLFLNWATPLNDQSTTQLCKDKEYFYRAAKDHLQMPNTVGYLNPDCEEQYQKYLEHHSIQEIAQDILHHFSLPVVVKKNRGSLGVCVFKCSSSGAVVDALEQIFDPHSKHFDYVALAQAYIPIQREFRVLFLEGKYQFGYQKNVTGASFSGNLSPLHWDGATAVLLEEDADAAMIQRLQTFCEPLYTQLGLRYAGLDVALDDQDNLWLIEANASPGFDYIVRDGGETRVLALYHSILRCLGADISQP